MQTPIETVANFCGLWDESLDKTFAAIRQYFTPQTVWDNVGAMVTVGPDAAIEFWQTFAKLGFPLIRVDMLHIAAAGNTVLTERVDHAVSPDGRVGASGRVMGVFELDGGKIVAWRDYTDPTFGAKLRALAS